MNRGYRWSAAGSAAEPADPATRDRALHRVADLQTARRLNVGRVWTKRAIAYVHSVRVMLDGSEAKVAFELVIAVKRDPSDVMNRPRSQDASSVRTAPVTTLEVSGDFSEAHAEELERHVERVLAGPAESVIIRFTAIDCERPSVLNFSRWLKGMRQAGSDIRIIEGDSPIHALLTENDALPDAAVPAADAEAATGRRTIDAHH